MPTPQPRDDQRQDAPRQKAGPPGLRRRTSRRAGYLISGACAVSVTALALAGCGAQATTYKASVLNFDAVSPGQLNVAVKVTNTGKAAGTPTCTVSAAYQSGAHGGTNSGTLNSTLAPGKSSVFYVEVALPGTASSNITDVNATC